eukprot:scaffold3815_cov355-Prasinococcus_capsulatus_cf.AAC.10
MAVVVAAVVVAARAAATAMVVAVAVRVVAAGGAAAAIGGVHDGAATAALVKPMGCRAEGGATPRCAALLCTSSAAPRALLRAIWSPAGERSRVLASRICIRQGDERGPCGFARRCGRCRAGVDVATAATSTISFCVPAPAASGWMGPRAPPRGDAGSRSGSVARAFAAAFQTLAPAGPRPRVE